MNARMGSEFFYQWPLCCTLYIFLLCDIFSKMWSHKKHWAAGSQKATSISSKDALYSTGLLPLWRSPLSREEPQWKQAHVGRWCLQLGWALLLSTPILNTLHQLGFQSQRNAHGKQHSAMTNLHIGVPHPVKNQHKIKILSFPNLRLAKTVHSSVLSMKKIHVPELSPIVWNMSHPCGQYITHRQNR